MTLCDPPSESTSNRITAFAEQGLSLCCWSSSITCTAVSSCVVSDSESTLLPWLHFWLSQVCGSGGGCAGGCGGCADHLSPQPAPSPLLTASLSVPSLPRELERAGKWLHQRQSSPADTLGSNISGGRKRNAGQSFPADSHTLDNNISLPQQGTEEKTKKSYIESEDGGFLEEKCHQGWMHHRQ